MNYVCRNCGQYITAQEYAKAQETGMGCLFFIICFFFVSIILIPLAIILWMLNKPKIKCPCCGATESLIPESAPIAQKLLKENNIIIPEKEIKTERIKKKRSLKEIIGIIALFIGVSVLTVGMAYILSRI